ncbi:MAG: hypothetical protein LBH48_09040 [Bifidobacteriaceae bacterium]|jgi:hypothetical protein|nr:hypothetical protein [Bifidobacteriaceae bacterium]
MTPPTQPHWVTGAEMLASPLWARLLDPDAATDLLAFVEAGRDAAGTP